MSPAANETRRVQIGGSSDIYTAVLGLAMLVLAVTTVVVCVYGLDLYDTFWEITKVP
ncbi:MAG: hypothetical protein JW810_08990 [Sedimentisphaerales bacterium]|nr:hypothetical protein [Sedimentisphaerales bacterium]